MAQGVHRAVGGAVQSRRSASWSSGSGARRSCPPATGTSPAAFGTSPAFTATLVGLDGNRVATGKDFDNQARVTRDDVVVVDETGARALVTALDGSTYTVSSVDERPYRSSPKAPFITSTLQQEGGRASWA